MGFKGKPVAIFGVGDSASYSANFCDAMGELYDCFKEAGAKFYGATATSEIEFDESKAVVDGKFVGMFSIKTMKRTRAMKELKDGSKLLHLRAFLSKPYVWLSNVETWEPPSTSLSTSMTVLLIQGVNSLDFSFNNKFEEYNTSRSSIMYKSTYTSCHQFLLLRRRE